MLSAENPEMNRLNRDVLRANWLISPEYVGVKDDPELLETDPIRH